MLFGEVCYSELHLKAFWESESLRSGMDCAALKVWRASILHILLVIIFEFESQNCVGRLTCQIDDGSHKCISIEF